MNANKAILMSRSRQRRDGRFTATVLLLATGWLAAVGAASAEPERPELVLQTPPAGAVNSVAISPDGGLVAAAANEGGVRLYDAQSGKLVRVIDGVGDRSLAFTPDGKRLAGGGFHMDKLIGIYDVATGKRLQTLAGHTEWEVDACVISPDGKLLASAGVDRQVLVWDLDTGELRHRLQSQSSRLPTLAFSPDGATLAGGGYGAIELWDLTSGKLTRTLSGLSGWACTLDFSSDGAKLASGSCDWEFHRGHDWTYPESQAPEQSEWRVWDLATSRPDRVEETRGRLLSVAFSPDDASLAVAIGDAVRVYSLRADTAPRFVTSHHFGVTSVAFTSDGASIVSGSHDQTVKRSDASNGQLVWQTPGHFEWVNSVALSSDGSILATGSSDGRFMLGTRKANASGIGPGGVRLWDIRSGRLLHRLGDLAVQIMAVALSPDGRTVLAGGGSPGGKGVVHAWAVGDGAPAWSADDHEADVLSVGISPDGLLAASGSVDGTVNLRDALTGAAVWKLSGHGLGASSLAFSPDGALLAVGSGDGAAIVWDVQSGRRIGVFRPRNSQATTVTGDRPMTTVAFSSDGKSLATASAGVHQTFAEPARFWNVATGEMQQEFSDISGRPMALSPDGKLLATGGKTVRLWNAATGEPLRELEGILKRTQAIVFSQDGRVVVSGGSYGTTNVWEVDSGELLVTLFGFPGWGSDPLEEDWLAYHTDGFYVGSPNAEKLLGWRVGNELLRPETIGRVLRSPEQLKRSLSLPPREPL